MQPAQGGERVEEAGAGLAGVPRPGDPGVAAGVLSEVPAPGQPVQPQCEAGGAFGALAFPGLRVLTAEDLLGVPNGHLDRPPAGVARGDVASEGGRWPTEVTFRDTKQALGGENPHSWKRQGPERAACLALWLHGLTWCWYLGQPPRGDTWIPRPWYPRKASPSFLDALAALRRLLWSQRITALSAAATTAHDKTKITEALLDTLAYAA